MVMKVLLLLYCLQTCSIAQLLEVFGLSTGNTGTVDRQPFHDLARLKKPLPQVSFVDGLPVIPGIVGSLPGAGACLPQQALLVKQRSPSFFQNIMRNIPGAQDYLSSFLPKPKVDVNHLFGKYMWAIDTPSVHDRFCSVTEFLPATKSRSGNSSAFSLIEKFRTQEVNGGEKTAFGYGLKNNDAVYIYFQDDPCPYQIVLLGPVDEASGQYEYVILSNWARFPIIGLVRDLRVFYDRYLAKMEDDLEKDGFTNSFTKENSIHYTDWSRCRKSSPVSYIRNVLTELFGK